MGDREEDDAFRSHWIAHPVAGLFPGVDPTRPDLTIEVRCSERPMTIRSSRGVVTVEEGPAAAPDLVLTGPPEAVIGVLARRISPKEAEARGLAFTGDRRILRRLRPSTASTTPTRGAASRSVAHG
jgi:hypothetical protein